MSKLKPYRPPCPKCGRPCIPSGMILIDGELGYDPVCWGGISEETGNTSYIHDDTFYCPHCPMLGSMSVILTSKELQRFKVEIDDTSAFGISHHNHNKHRVFISGLSYKQAIYIQKQLKRILTMDENDPML